MELRGRMMVCRLIDDPTVGSLFLLAKVLMHEVGENIRMEIWRASKDRRCIDGPYY